MPLQQSAGASTGDSIGNSSSTTQQNPASQPSVSTLAYQFYKYHIAFTAQIAGITANGTYPQTSNQVVNAIANQIIGVPNQPVDRINIPGRYHHAVQVSGTLASATVQVKGSVDGIEFNNIGSAIAANGITQITGLYQSFQFVVAAITGTTSFSITLMSTAQ